MLISKKSIKIFLYMKYNTLLYKAFGYGEDFQILKLV